MRPVNREIQLRQIRHFYKADTAYGEGVAAGLGNRNGRHPKRRRGSTLNVQPVPMRERRKMLHGEGHERVAAGPKAGSRISVT